jgi:hypothetical protein
MSSRLFVSLQCELPPFPSPETIHFHAANPLPSSNFGAETTYERPIGPPFSIRLGQNPASNILHRSAVATRAPTFYEPSFIASEQVYQLPSQSMVHYIYPKVNRDK